MDELPKRNKIGNIKGLLKKGLQHFNDAEIKILRGKHIIKGAKVPKFDSNG